MPLIEYVSHRFGAEARGLIDKANAIIAQYVAQGYRLTLRQLYYRLVAATHIANTVREYKNLGNLIVQARRAGLVDWDAIEDRTRNIKSLRHWYSASDAVTWLRGQYSRDKWAEQHNRIEVWIEKEALAGVFERACAELDVPFLCCRGNNSESEMWQASQRFEQYAGEGQEITILYFGDHDPSGIDMTRDVRKRLEVFGADLVVDRRALNMDQVRRHKLPPNPAKHTDSRYKAYVRQFGRECWELDALEPQVLDGIARHAVLALRNEKAWERAERQEAADIRKLAKAAKSML